MTTETFIANIKSYASENDLIKLYPLNNMKAYQRFWERLFWLPEVVELKAGWLGDLYSQTNGIDLLNYHIIPYNNYFNKKTESFDEFCREWIVNQDNPNEILADFYSFMTDKNSLIGYLENLKNVDGDHFIAFSRTPKRLKDVDIIFSSIYKLYDYIIESLNNDKILDFSHPIDFWRERDKELNTAYSDNLIENYKLNFLFQDDSDILKSRKG